MNDLFGGEVRDQTSFCLESTTTKLLGIGIQVFTIRLLELVHPRRILLEPLVFRLLIILICTSFMAL